LKNVFVNVENLSSEEKKQLSELKGLVSFKDQEIMQRLREYDQLNEKYQKLKGESLITCSNAKKNIKVDFPQPEKLSNEKMREAYKYLLEAYKSSLAEREEIMDNYRKETINCEEQRNYNNILKETIEKTLSKVKVKGDANSLVNVHLFRKENEKLKSDLAISGSIISDLRKEVEEFKSKKVIINETLEAGFQELEMTKNKISDLEREKEELEETLEKIKTENEKKQLVTTTNYFQSMNKQNQKILN